MKAHQDISDYLDKITPSFWGKFFYYCLPFRKTVVLSNMRFVFGQQLDSNQIKKLAQCFYSHIARSIRENIVLRFMNEEQVKAKATVIGAEYMFEAAKHNKGIAVLTGHFGNWEFAPIAGILNFKAFQGRFHFIRKTLKNKKLEHWLFRRYYRAGLGVIPKKNSLNRVCDVLAEEQAVVFVMDQHASIQAKDGILVDFFGKKAGTYRSLATIARYTQVPVVPAASYRQKDGTHVLEFFPPINWQEHENTKQALYQNTLAYNQALELMVLAHPEQWLWMHKRWKH